MRVKQEGTLYVDDASNQTISPKKADILDVVGMLYVGGLPINYTTRRIGPVSLSFLVAYLTVTCVCIFFLNSEVPCLIITYWYVGNHLIREMKVVF